jgi:catechol 2,3-dioxygenase-like lactoylglutathione lyase family enzyme
VPGALTQFQAAGLDLQGKLQNDPSGNPFCWVKDPYGNLFQVIQSDSWFTKDKYLTGGPSGCIIGSSDIEASRKLYSDLLGYDHVVYDKSGMFSDFSPLPGGKQKYRRVLLTHSKPRQGGFSRVFGQTHIELIQALDRTPKKIFEGRMWGDLGFIHLCFDIVGMDELRESCAEKGFPFTIDSATAMGKEFDMGEAAGLFSYIEDPDGTLIEFVETYKLPLLKKLGWYLDMRKRDPAKPLPNWMMKALRFNRVKA